MIQPWKLCTGGALSHFKVVFEIKLKFRSDYIILGGKKSQLGCLTKIIKMKKLCLKTFKTWAHNW